MGTRHFRPRTTYDMKARVETLAERITGREPDGFHDALTVVVEHIEEG